MKPEKLMDAMNLLPDDLLEETDTLRRRKQIPWKSMAALAACLCLVAGLWLLQPGNQTAESAKGENGSMEFLEDRLDTFSRYYSTHSFDGKECLAVTVTSVFDGGIGVVEGLRDDHVIDGTGTLIDLSKLETVPQLRPGQHLKLYFTDPPETSIMEAFEELAFVPYKLEIVEG